MKMNTERRRVPLPGESSFMRHFQNENSLQVNQLSARDN